MSPEVVNKNGHNKLVDFYTLGALLYELLFGMPPFYEENRDVMFYNIQNKELIIDKSDGYTKELYDLLEYMLNKNMTLRPQNICDIKNHKWLQNVD